VHYAINMALDTPVAKERYRPDDPTSNVLELVLGTADGLLERINRVRQVHAPGCAEYPNSSIYDVVRRDRDGVHPHGRVAGAAGRN
jgi:hypothetical protein